MSSALKRAPDRLKDYSNSSPMISHRFATKLITIIVEVIYYQSNIVSHSSRYLGFTVSFYKRAQILIGDIWACFEGKDLGTFHDIDHLTMFPDYRVPQVLIHFGAMRYSDSLLNKLKSGTLFMIRSNTISMNHLLDAQVENWKNHPPKN